VGDAQARRRDRLRTAIAEHDLDALLVTSLVNVRYLTGFTGSNGVLLVATEGDDASLFGTDFRYRDRSVDEVPDLPRLTDPACVPATFTSGVAAGLRRVGFEAHDVTVESYDALREVAGAAELVPAGRLVEPLRTVKDEEELALLAAACAVGDRALADLAPRVRPGLTERAIARLLEDLMRDHGAHELAFESIVAAGPHSAFPHHEPSDRPVERGELLTLDFGAAVGGYHADMTRTFVVGASPAGWQEEVYGVVRAAQRAGRHALRPGADVRAVDEAARSVVRDAGYGPQFGHGLGHGVGLEIHEAPALGPAATGTLDAGSPVTVEPGVYLPGRGGVRIEDTLVVRDGAPELLTTSSKELLVLG
jgi:Xaa-Pro aminopeptidase